ncbi:MAG: GFA family protein [Alphaproteobacteria bacterium]|nr:GFA family protein [Alphaproteobacteria bacterium]
MSDDVKMTGGCMCGAVRYETTGQSFGVIHCHCHSCRKHNGAAVVTLAGFTADQVVFSGDERKIYESSAGIGRAFCGRCGTPLTWEGDSDDRGRILEFHISTFDNPDVLVPTAHAFEPERIPWFDVADNLPRYRGFTRDGAPLRHGPVSEGLPAG